MFDDEDVHRPPIGCLCTEHRWCSQHWSEARETWSKMTVIVADRDIRIGYEGKLDKWLWGE